MKQYAIINTEPNCNLLGLHPIIRAFFHEEMKKLTGRSLKIFIYQLEDEIFNAGAIKEDWFGFGEYLFNKMNDDHEFANQVKDYLLKNGQELYNLCLNTLASFKTGELSKVENKTRIIKILDLFVLICVAGLVAPLIEMGGGGMSNKIAGIIKSKNLKNLGLAESEVLSILTTPRINTWTEDFRSELYLAADWLFEHQEDLNNLSVLGKQKILEAIEKFGWVFYGYKGPEYSLANAQEEIANILAKKIKPSEQLLELKNNFSRLLLQQEKLMTDLNFSDEEKYFVAVAQDFGYTKAYRANLMALADYTVNKLLTVFAKEEGYSVKQLGFCTMPEMVGYLQDKVALPSIDVLNERSQYALLISYPDHDEVLVGEEAKTWMQDNVEVEEVDLTQTEFSGTVACAGGVETIKGTAKIIMSNKDIGKIEPGDILVSTNTTPDHVPAMRRAAAIVTQTGGLTCHAAIVSRELNKPCIVGVKNLLKIFKDGDLLEVDIENGLVRKIDSLI